ncbi:MAG: hypothetical protein U0V73_01495 [Acidimicrobiia bacterium]
MTILAALAVVAGACGSDPKTAGPDASIADLKETALAQAGIVHRTDLPETWVDAVRTDAGSQAAMKAFHTTYDAIRACPRSAAVQHMKRARTATASSDDLVSGSDRKIAVSRSHVFEDAATAKAAFDLLASQCTLDAVTKALRDRIDAAPGVSGVAAQSAVTTAPQAGDAAAGAEVTLNVQTQEAPVPVAFQLGVVRAGRVVSVVMLGAVADPFDTGTRDGVLQAIVDRASRYQ